MSGGLVGRAIRPAVRVEGAVVLGLLVGRALTRLVRYSLVGLRARRLGGGGRAGRRDQVIRQHGGANHSTDEQCADEGRRKGDTRISHGVDDPGPTSELAWIW